MIPIAIVMWAIYSTKLLLDAGSTPLLIAYQFYLVYLMVMAFICRANILCNPWEFQRWWDFSRLAVIFHYLPTVSLPISTRLTLSFS